MFQFFLVFLQIFFIQFFHLCQALRVRSKKILISLIQLFLIHVKNKYMVQNHQFSKIGVQGSIPPNIKSKTVKIYWH